jgi:hypothetical protein
MTAIPPLLIEPAGPTARAWATCDPLEDCRAALHKKAFRLTHPLAGNPLFSVQALVSAAQDAARKRPRDVYMDAGKVSVYDKWGKIPVPELPVDEVIKRLETADAWIVVKNVETDPKYRGVLGEWTAFARSVAGPEGARLFTKPEIDVIMTSPRRVTPCHFDRQINFLVQLQGAKDVWVADPRDTTDREVEHHYTVRLTCGNHTPQVEARASKFLLAPGEGVHIPTHAKHWVTNRDEISVSLSLNFEFPEWVHGVYRTNFFLRRLGLSPRPPGQGLVGDRLKGTIGTILGRTKRTAGVVYRSARRLVRR